MIKEKRRDKVEIDLTGPQGNVFNLIGVAMDLGREINRRRGGNYIDIKSIQEDMMSSDYEHAIEVLEKHFGDYVIMYR
jgi:hypothetical protein